MVCVFADGVSEIFANVEQLLAFNSRFLQDLTAEYEKHKQVGSAFKQVENLLETYSVYVQNYPDAMKR